MLARGLDAPLGHLLLGLVLRDARCLVDEAATLLRPRRDNEPDASLLNDGVSLGANARAEEELHDVTQPTWHTTKQILALDTAIKAPGHHDLCWAGRAPGYAPGGRVPGQAGGVESQRHFCHASRPAGLRAREDHVIHGSTAKMLRRLLAHDPADRVDNI